MCTKDDYLIIVRQAVAARWAAITMACDVTLLQGLCN